MKKRSTDFPTHTFSHMSWILWLASAVRCAGLFMSYGTLARHDVEVPQYVLVLAVVYGVAEVLVRSKSNPNQSSGCGDRITFTQGLLHAGRALLWLGQIVAMALATLRLHPFRVCVGEQLSSVLFGMVVIVSKGSSRGQWAIAIPLTLGALATLAWANSITATHTHKAHHSMAKLLTLRPNHEDRIHSFESMSGMFIVVFGAVLGTAERFIETHSESLKISEERAHSWLRAVVAVTSAGLLCAVASTTFSLQWSLELVVDLFIDASCLVVIPALIKYSQSRSRAIQQMAAYSAFVRAAASVMVGFLLHTMYHSHYRKGVLVTDEAVHPIFHGDNVMVLLSGCGMVAAVRAVAKGHRKYHRGVSSSDDDPLAIEGEYALLGQTPAALFTAAGRDILSISNPAVAPPARRGAIWNQLRELCSDSRLRRLTIFFTLTMLFMLVELVYGLQANSLSLVSDALHMLLDAMSIALGLLTSLMAKWPPSADHPFGYQGYEVLSGLANGLALVVVALLLLAESLHRLLVPEAMDGEYLLAVAVGGLVVNVIGVVFFHDAHHGHSHSGQAPEHDHGHSHGCEDHRHGDSHSDCPMSSSASNMRGVYLHILSDLLGSVAVIVSVFVGRATGATFADPLCSAAISCVILWSSGPLLSDAATMLLRQYQRVEGHDTTCIPSSSCCSSQESTIGSCCDGVGLRVQSVEVFRSAGGAKLVCIRAGSANKNGSVRAPEIRKRLRQSLAAALLFPDDSSLIVEVN